MADVHLGLKAKDPAGRESRFVGFLKGLKSPEVSALYLLGDIWDFWYEYKDVIPREGARVVAQLIRLLDEGVEVYYVPGNHDIWCYSFFESLGVRKIDQPYFTNVQGRNLCLGHGDAVGGAKWSYRLLLSIFHCRFLQRLFSLLHPTLAFRFGLDWSDSNRRSHGNYVFRNEDEPLWKFAQETGMKTDVHAFIFGHYHVNVDQTLPCGSRLIVLGDWISGGTPHAVMEDGVITSF